MRRYRRIRLLLLLKLPIIIIPLSFMFFLQLGIQLHFKFLCDFSEFLNNQLIFRFLHFFILIFTKMAQLFSKKFF